MGDRSNIVIEQGDGTRLYFYSHWSGLDGAWAAVRDALKRGGDRRTDLQYFARIVFESFVGENRGGITGFGITTSLHDNENALLVVDVDKQTVGLARSGQEPKCYRSWTFAEFEHLAFSGDMDEPESK